MKHLLNDRWITVDALAVAAVSLGYSLQTQALLWLTIALIACIVAIARPTIIRIEALGEELAILILGGGLALQISQLLIRPPGIYLQLTDSTAYTPFFMGLACAAVLAGAGLSKAAWLGHMRFPLVLVVHFLLGIWLIKASPNPFIDVYIFQRDASRALLHATNPYAMSFPNIYGDTSRFYGAGLSVGGRLTFGFPYPPLSLLLALPGHVFGGDLRYSQLAAITLTGALIAYSRPSRLSMTAAAIFLFTPRVFFMLEQAWTEPFVTLLLAATVFSACRIPKTLPLVLGLLFVVKQYLLFAGPAIVLLVSRPLRLTDLWRLIWKAALVGSVVTVPLALWDVSAFVWSVVSLQFYQPFRLDGHGFFAWLARRGGPQLSVTATLAVTSLAATFALWRSVRSPAGFAATVALIYFAFFAFNKQSSVNYYFFVLGALCCAIAAAQPKCDPRA